MLWRRVDLTRNRCPIWTTFINYRVASTKWIRRVEPRKIHFGDLQRYVFSPDYMPQRGPHGEEELFFFEEKGTALNSNASLRVADFAKMQTNSRKS